MKHTFIPALIVLAACGESTLGLQDMAAPSDFAAEQAGPASMRRLTHAQYKHALTDLFGSELVIPPLVEPDLIDGGLASVGASSASYSPRGVESMEQAAFAIAEQVDSSRLEGAAASCDLADDACMRDVLGAWGRLIWRRALQEEELERILAIAQNARTALSDDREGLTYGLAALLQSPHFLYRIELGEEGRLTDLELATRLAFFLWNTTPDDHLISLAETGGLSTDEDLFRVASQMLDDERARRGVREFFSEALHLDDLDELRKDPKLFEHFDTELGPAAKEETLRLLEYAALDAEWDYRELMTTRETFLNPRLASLYGVPAPSLEGFAPMSFGEDIPRAGLLGHASFLNLHAHSVSSSATLRGEAVRVLLLCQPIPAPPVDVDTSIPEPSGTTLTLRDRVAEHLENPSCKGCHMLTDPIGLGLENYDAVGRWRDLDNGAVIDPTGDLDGEAFTNPVDLGAAIGRHPSFPRCLVRNLSRYAAGRIETMAEVNWMTTLEGRFEHHEYRLRPLFLEMVMSPIFRQVGAPSDELPNQEG